MDRQHLDPHRLLRLRHGPDVDWQNAGPLVGPGGGWDNEIGSASAYSNCTGRYWANSGFWGANIDTGWSGGVMNDASSSIQWY